MNEFLIDTNVFSAIFKGNARVKVLIENHACALDTIVYIELIQGAKDKAEVQRIEKYLTRFRLIYVSEAVSRKAVELIREYSKSHGLMLGDAMIAATCLEHNLKLLTYNLKDFRFIEGLQLLSPDHETA